MASSLHELAMVLYAQGDLAGARARLEQVLQIEGRVFGTRDHFSTAVTEMALARLLSQQGEPDRARELLQHAHQAFLAQLGPEHPHTKEAAELLSPG